MPRDEPYDLRRDAAANYVERRDPRMSARPHDDDVRIERRDPELYRAMPPVTHRSFGPRTPPTRAG